MLDNIEITNAFLYGLNVDVNRLISFVPESVQLDEKLYKAEFATGGFKGTCNSCFKGLKDEQLLLVSYARNLNGDIYRICTCLECSKKKLNSFKQRYINRR